jgi:toxin-antitoxin system PIN domain toxin
VSVALLDVNVLIPLLWPGHVHREMAKDWFIGNRHAGWATCSITEAGFARVSRSQSIPGASVQHHMRLLEEACSAEDHEFWSLDTSLKDIHPEIRQRLVGHGQITDAILLDLAIRRGGRLVTFDQGMSRLLPTNSPHYAALEVLG